MIMKILRMKQWLAKAAGVAVCVSACFVPAAYAQTTGGWTLNINNTGYNPLPAGGLLPYAVRIDNNDNKAKPASKITFTVPANTVYLGVDGLQGCSPDPDSAEPVLDAPLIVTCDVAAINPGGHIDAKVNMRPMVTGTVSLSGKITNPDNEAGNPGPFFERKTTIEKGADLALSLQVEKSELQAGSEAKFTAKLVNNGPSEAGSAKLSMPLPIGLSADGLQLPQYCSYLAPDILCDIPGPIAVGAEINLPFSAQVITKNASTITISAKLTSDLPRDPVNINNDADISISVIEGTDVSLGKTRDPQGLLLVGGKVSFTLQPRYAGTEPTQANIEDILPANYKFVSVSAGPGWSCPVSGQTIACVYQKSAGSDYTAPIIIEAIAELPTEQADGVTNIATVSSPDENIDAQDNNSAEDGKANIANPVIDLVAHKSGPPRDLVTVGNSYDFELFTENEGNAGFFGELTITDRLPEGLTLTGVVEPKDWSCSPQKVVGPADIVCTTNQYTKENPLGSFEKTAPIVLTTKVTGTGKISNGMLVSFDDYKNLDAKPGNNETSAGVTSADDDHWADISVNKSVVAPSPATLNAGEEVTFRMEIVNHGPGDAENVVLDDRLNDIVSSETGGKPVQIVPQFTTGLGRGMRCDAEKGSDYYRNLQCIIDTLPKCEAGKDCPVVNVTVRAGSQGAKTNTAVAFSTITPDNNPLNNTASAGYTVIGKTDVEVKKVSPASSAGVAAGQELVYVLTARVLGTGLSDADNVVITDILPNDLRFVSAVANGGGVCTTSLTPGMITRAGANTISCDFGTLKNGAQETATIIVIPTTKLAKQEITNSATITTSTAEPNKSNNQTQLPVNILPPELDLIVTKTDSTDPLEIEASTVYTVTVRNSGPSDSFNIKVIDKLPLTGLANPQLLTTPANGSCVISNGSPTVAGGTINCDIPYLAANTSVNFTVDMKGVARGRHTNNVEISSDEILGNYEGPADNNTDYEDTTVRVKSDLVVTKTPSVTTVDLREEFSWTITVHNKTGAGLDVAEFVTLVDELPDGMELTAPPVASVGRCTGKEGDRKISCELGDLATGETVTITLKTKITKMSAQAVKNTATADTLSFDQDITDNTASGVVSTVKGSSISGTIYRDFDKNDLQASTDTGIAGVPVTVTGTSKYDGATITRTLNTDAKGDYSFTDLPPGTYTVSYGKISEEHLVDGKALPAANGVGEATIPTASGVNTINGIVITNDFAAVKHDFTRVPVARIGIGKVAGSVNAEPDGNIVVKYNLHIKNLSLEPVAGITVTDKLSDGFRNFGTHNSPQALQEGQYYIKSVSADFGVLQSNFNGDNQTTLLSGGTLAAGATGTVSYEVVIKPVVPRAVPALIYTNQANVTGTGELSKQPVDDISNNTTNPDPDGNGIANEPINNNPTLVSPKPNPQIKLEKTATPVRTSGAAAVDDRINYSFKITNTGNTPLINVKLTDVMVGLQGLPDISIARLNPGESDDTTYTAYYILTQQDLDNGSVDNTAKVVGQWGVQNGTPVNVETTADAKVPALSDPKLTILKSRASDTIQNPTRVGDTITYKFTVTNTGNTIINDVTVSDVLKDIKQTPDGSFAIGTLNPGQAKTVEAVYTVTLQDINAGTVDNIASADGFSGADKTPVTTDPSDVQVPLFAAPKLELVKELTSAVPDAPRVGDTLTWTVTATNTGNVTLKNLVLSDAFPNAVITPANVASLEPLASVEFTVTAPLKQSDINAGEVVNTATIDFTDPADKPQPPVDDTENKPLPQKPGIELIKTGDVSALTAPPVIGQQITYTITIKNTGNVPLDTITLHDHLPTFKLNDGEAARLAAATLEPEDEIEVKGTYAITADDIDKGEVHNIADTTGISVPTPSEKVTDEGETTTSLDRNAGIELIKTITNKGLSTPPKVGDVITYGFEIKNTGNVTINEIVLTELAGVDIQNAGKWSGPLAAGESNTDAFTATYALKQSDIDKGIFVNDAKVTGTSAGSTVKDDVTDSDTVDVVLDKTAALSIVKSESSAFSTPPTPGDIITYSFVVTNTGNVTLTDVVVTDPLTDLVMNVDTIATLLPGVDNAVTLTATYALKQTDIEAGQVVNKASVTGVFTDPVTNKEETVPPVESNEIIVPVTQLPKLSLVKTAVSGLSEPANEGEEITYTFTVINTGNMHLTGVTVEDPLPGITPSSFAAGDMAPGEAKTFTAIYAITLSDIDNEQVVNQATASGSYDDGSGPKPVTDLSGPDIDSDEPVVVPVIPPLPELKIIKTGKWIDENGNGYPEVGERVDYTFAITNTGNAVLFNVTPDDIGPSFNNKPATGKLSAFTPAPVELKPGAAQTFTATYLLTQEDIDAAAGILSAVTNKALALGNVRNGTEYQSPESLSKVTLPAAEPNDVVITKQALLRQVKRGEKVPYIIRVENGSSSNAGPVNVIDTMPAGFRYVEGSASVDGTVATPVVNGRQIQFDGLALGPKAIVEIRVDLLVLSTAGPGKHTNVASVTDTSGTPLAKDATAIVEIVAEPVFDCGDIVGKVFDDKNRNGYQDEGEPGLPGVRIATAKGWLVTTDAHGRFHVACAALPDQRIGSNFIMKVDTRTLPSGYRLTTENPRVVRLTAGKMSKLNFGASVGRVVRLDVTGDAFEQDSTELKHRWTENLDALTKLLRTEISVLRLSYIDTATSPELAKQRVKQLRELITERWKQDGARYQLEIETRLEVGK